jgi:anti-anti-sigma regulatory factor
MTNTAQPLDDLPWRTGDTTLSLSLGTTLDPTTVSTLRQKLGLVMVAPRQLYLDCATVRSVDPVGAALLWQLCGELERSVGTKVTLVHLSTTASYRLRNHPLAKYVAQGEELFQDPFGSTLPSNR